MKSALELNRLLLKFLLLCYVDLLEHSREDNAKFNFLGIRWENKRFWRVYFLGSQIQYTEFIKNLSLCATRGLERMQKRKAKLCLER